MTENKPTQKRIQFATVNNFANKLNTALPLETVSGNGYVKWGRFNDFPEYLFNRITECPTLSTLVQGTSDYIIGKGLTGIQLEKNTVNNKGEDLQDIVEKCAYDLIAFGGFCLQLIYDSFGNISDLYYVDIRFCRLSECESKVIYNKTWKKGLGSEEEIYPVFNRDTGAADKSQILFYTGKSTRTYYPVPMYFSAISAIETEIEIQKFHYNNIKNNFTTNVIVNINNGIPSEEEKTEIEKRFKAKYTGAENSGEILFLYNDNKEQAATIERMAGDNFDTQYEALYRTTRENIYASFRAIPALFGIMTATTGFSEQEFTEAFKLFNHTVVAPRQKEIKRIFDYLYGIENLFEFIPFSLESSQPVNE